MRLLTEGEKLSTSMTSCLVKFGFPSAQSNFLDEVGIDTGTSPCAEAAYGDRLRRLQTLFLQF